MIRSVDEQSIPTPVYSIRSLPNKEERKQTLAEVRRLLPTSLHLEEQQQDKILAEDRERQRKEDETHKMAEHRIEVQYGTDRSSVHPCTTKVRVWRSGKSLGGEGDVSMIWCNNQKCLVPFDSGVVDELGVVCPHCFQKTPPDAISSSLLFKKTLRETSVLVAQLFYLLRGDCDVVVKYMKRSIQSIETSKEMHQDDVLLFREKYYERAVYPYWRILTDTIHGQSLVKRLEDFLG